MEEISGTPCLGSTFKNNHLSMVAAKEDVVLQPPGETVNWKCVV